MKGLLIVGHLHSDYQFIEKTLYDQGMSKAKPSRRETLTPTAISQELLQTHDISFDNKTEICQLNSGEIWNGLALDLLLGNKDQLFWGWADPKAILLLNYWKKLGPQLKFLLAYDTPEAICNNIFKNKCITPQALEQEVQHWKAFYEELLYFYQRNQQNCLLVHIQQIKENFSSFIDSTSQLVGYSPVEKDSIILPPAKESKTEQLLITELLKDFPAIYDSYATLESVADIPLSDKKTHPINNHITIWNNLNENNKLQKKNEDSQTKKIISLKEDTKNIVIQQKSELKSFKDKNKNLINQHNKEKNLLSIKLNNSHSELKKASDESELLLLQSHQDQEKIEHYFIKNNKIKKELSSFKDKNKNLINQHNKEKSLLSIKLNNSHSDLKEASDESELLLLQLHQVQEELEHYFIKNNEIKKEISSFKDKNIELEENKKNTIQQIKQEKNKFSIIYKEKEIVEKEKNDLRNQYKKQLDSIRATQEKNSLAEREENNLLQSKLYQIHHIQQELEGYLTNNKIIEEKLRVIDKKNTKPKFYYGAGERTKQHLSYRVGAIMIQRSKSFSGWLTMPIALLKEVIVFRKQLKKRKDEKLPAISQYQDASEAEHVKQYLTYRLGYALVVNTKSLTDFLTLPWRLRKEVLEFKKRKEIVG